MSKLKIAIDGPSGAGKSELARALAARLGCFYLDTGALYRTVGLHMFRKGIAREDTEGIRGALAGLDVEVRRAGGEQRVCLFGEDVSEEIRRPEVSMYASAVSAIPEVRTFLLGIQRSAADEGNVVMDGRDIGTVIMPDADVKIFLTARPELRAERRVKQLREKGKDCDYETVLRELVERDKNDSTRAASPAKPAADAVVLDNSDINFDETVGEAVRIIRGRTQK